MLRAVSYSGHIIRGRATWLCICDCGTEKQVVANGLMTGNSASCGCQKRVLARERLYTNGGRTNDTYDLWAGMIQRCTNPNHSRFNIYGGRGITVCPLWRDFAVFHRDMGDRPSKKHSIDRKDNNLGYSPDNCRWATMTEQANNKRNSRLIEYDGRTMTISLWADAIGMNRNTLRDRILYRGMTVDNAMTMPVATPKARCLLPSKNAPSSMDSGIKTGQ